jgi:hypothetical protein
LGEQCLSKLTHVSERVGDTVGCLQPGDGICDLVVSTSCLDPCCARDLSSSSKDVPLSNDVPLLNFWSCMLSLGSCQPGSAGWSEIGEDR